VKNKAEKNLSAAEFLIERKLFDPAASRVYYAAFQAAVVGLAAVPLQPSDARAGATYWNHDMVLQTIYRVRKSRADEHLMKTLKGLREKADYDPIPVDPAAVKSWMTAVEKFVGEYLS